MFESALQKGLIAEPNPTSVVQYDRLHHGHSPSIFSWVAAGKNLVESPPMPIGLTSNRFGGSANPTYYPSGRNCRPGRLGAYHRTPTFSTA